MSIAAAKSADLYVKSKSMFIFSLLVSLSIFWGVASFQHIGPGFFDIYINLQISIVLSIAFTICLLCLQKKHTAMVIPVLSWGWLYFLVVVAVQPLINDIFYADGLIFVLGEFVLVFLLSVLIANMPNKLLILKMVTLAVFSAAIFTLLTLIIQTLQITFFYDWLVMPIDINGRPVGNVSQPNQAAFLLVLGALALFYMNDTKMLIRHQFVALSIFLLFSIGLALTSSRGGIILMILAILSYPSLKDDSKIHKVKRILLLMAIFIVGYLLGSFLLEFFREEVQTGIERFSGNLIRNRLSQLMQAMLIFSDHWLTGAGWGNYASAGLQYKDEIDWVYFSNHSHLIFSNIMAELGLIGLLGSLVFVYVIGKSLLNYKKHKEDTEYRLAVSVCLCVAAYSFSEFPLWYLKYLLIFVVYSSFLDKPTNISSVFLRKKIALVLPLLIMTTSFFYLNEYSKYTKAYNYFVLSDDTTKQKFQIYSELPIPYGFTFYNEAMLFYLLPLNQQQLEYKLTVGNRIAHKNPIPNIMIKQAIFLGFAHRESEALDLFKFSCLYNYDSECDFVIDRLNLLENELPTYFTTINSNFTNWRQDNVLQ